MVAALFHLDAIAALFVFNWQAVLFATVLWLDFSQPEGRHWVFTNS